MKNKTAILAALTLGLSVCGMYAQQDGPPPQDGPPGQGQGGRPPGGEGQRGFGGPGGPGGQGGQGQGRQGGFRPPMNPLMTALDANNDGKIDESEIANAPAALKKLDKNGDGIISQDEMRPEGGFRGGRGGQQGFGGGQGFGRRGQGGPEGQGPGQEAGPGFGRQGPGGPDGQQGPQRGGQGINETDFVARMMQNDKNGDGKISKDELPEQMQRILTRGDTNKDGALDKAEIEAMAARFQRGGGGGRPPQGGEGQQGRPQNLPQRPPSE